MQVRMELDGAREHDTEEKPKRAPHLKRHVHSSSIVYVVYTWERIIPYFLLRRGLPAFVEAGLKFEVNAWFRRTETAVRAS